MEARMQGGQRWIRNWKWEDMPIQLFWFLTTLLIVLNVLKELINHEINYPL
jgi:hypothetical protein